MKKKKKKIILVFSFFAAPPLMIVIEFMSNGSLDNFLKVMTNLYLLKRAY